MSILPKHKIIIYYDKIIGTGACNKVVYGKYKKKQVAIKIIMSDNMNEKTKRQLQKELDIILLLSKHPHPNIIKYHKIYKLDDRVLIVMELCTGGELKKYSKQSLDYTIICDYYNQIISGYNHIFKLNIIHRDIKSANILLSDDKKTIKFIDFGLSVNRTADCNLTVDRNLNTTICGSPLFMAPELLLGNPYNTKIDVWSIGIILYEMIYGKTPYHVCNTINELKYAVCNQTIDYPPIGYNQQPVPRHIILHLQQLLNQDPCARINLQDNNYLLESTTYPATPTPRPSPQSPGPLESYVIKQPIASIHPLNINPVIINPVNINPVIINSVNINSVNMIKEDIMIPSTTSLIDKAIINSIYMNSSTSDSSVQNTNTLIKTVKLIPNIPNKQNSFEYFMRKIYLI